MGKFVEWYLKKPHALLAILLFFSVLGLIGYKEIPRKFFPDASRPQVAVITLYPGASAEEVASQITRPIEKTLMSLNLVRDVSSTSKDGVSVVIAEFEYEKGLSSAQSEVLNELSKVAPLLPRGATSPQVYKITDATNPVMVLALSPKESSGLTLADVRRIAENEIKDELLRIKEVSDVEIFGGYRSAIEITPDYLKMASLGIGLEELIKAVRDSTANAPVGMLIGKEGLFTIKLLEQPERAEAFEEIVIKGNVKLKDVAKVSWSYEDNLSAYHGNGKRAIGLSILRASEGGYELPTIQAVLNKLPELKEKFPNINFEISDSQRWLIELSNKNMLEALRDAVIMTLLVIFLFLANVRMLLVSFFSIPITYLITIALMWLFGLDFNIVTLTGIILALGMLTDDAVVVLENIERHYFELKKEIWQASVDGTKEVMLAVLSGTYTTIFMLLPIVFIGGYVEKILKPLALTLIIALVVSYFVAITVIPLAAPKFLKKTPEKNWLEERVYRLIVKGIVNRLASFYTGLLEGVLESKPLRLFTVILLFALLLLTVKNVIPTVGRDLMPPMDTGLVIVRAEAEPNTSLEETEKILSKMEEIVYSLPEEVLRLSSTIGSEPGVLSFGSGKTPQQIEMKIQFTDRFSRERTIWEIEEELLSKFSKIANLKYVNVMDFGATPLSSIKATVDEMIYGEEPKVLDKIGRRLEELLLTVKGLTSTSRSWYYDKEELILKVDSQKASLYGLTPLQVANYVAPFIRGASVSLFIVPNRDAVAIRVILPRSERDFFEKIKNLPVPTKEGYVPLSYFASVEKHLAQSRITHKNLLNTLDVYGYRFTAPTTFIQSQVDALKEKLELPPGYAVASEGEIKEMKESFKRLIKALAVGVIILYFSLVPAFSSFSYPVSILAAIPLSLIGAAFAMLLSGKPQCMPSMMGLILLAGIIVKNSILLIDFIKEARERGASLKEAIIDSVRVRTRPVLMTAFATSVGMVPIALGWALGLERLAPLAVVAIGGLILGTFLTLFFVPVLVSLLERERS